MDDADALLAAVDADPASALPRLMWADYLDDAGHPLPAEFVRVCCRLACGPELDPGEIKRLRRLRAELYRRLMAERPGAVAGLWPEFTDFDRGLPREPVFFRMADFLTASPHWWPAVPVRHVGLHNARAKSARALTECPYLPRLRGLALGYCFYNPAARRFESPATPVTDDVLRALAGCDRLALTRLAVAAMRPQWRTVEKLAAAPWLARVNAADFQFGLSDADNLHFHLFTCGPGETPADVLHELMTDHGHLLRRER